jgi:hypothetical protein
MAVYSDPPGSLATVYCNVGSKSASPKESFVLAERVILL